MARIRTIKPEFPQSETVGQLSREARLLFVQLWTIADDAGRLRGASRMLASLLYPYDDDAPTLMPTWLEELDAKGCIRRYEIEGSHYIEIINWLKHQKIDRPSKSHIPPFDEPSRRLAKPREPSSTDLGPRTVDRGPRTIAAPNGAHPESKTPEAELFQRGKELLGPKSGGLITDLLKAKGKNVALARAALETASTKENAREYIGAIVRGGDPPGDQYGVDRW